jgi:hypothetical protein
MSTPVPETRGRIWSDAKQAWWRPGAAGYTTNIDEAGLFSASMRFGPNSPSRFVPLDAPSPVRRED